MEVTRLNYVCIALLMALGSASAAALTAQVTTGSSCLKLRAKPSYSSSAKTCLPSTSQVTVLSKSRNGYSYIEIDGVKGYAYTKYLRASAVSRIEAPAATQPAATNAVVSSGKCLNLRSDDSTRARVMGCVSPSTPVKVIDRNRHGYSLVEVDGRRGYMWDRYLKPQPEEQQATAPTTEITPPLPERPITRPTAPPKPQSLVRRPVIRACLKDNRSYLTHYNSDPKTYRTPKEARMEGGASTRFNKKEYLNAVEQAIKNGRPVSLAADYTGEFGRRCNQNNRRCTLLVYSKGFDKRYPEYQKKFPGLPEDTFVGIIEDTGGDFIGKGTRKLDLAVHNRAYSTGVSDYNMRFTEINSPCGKSRSARYCDLSNLQVADMCNVARNRVSPDTQVATVQEQRSTDPGEHSAVR